MRNTKYFDLNVFDEEIKLPKTKEDLELNSYFFKSLTKDQKNLLNSPFLRKVELASQKWYSVCEKHDDKLCDFFKRRGEEEFIKTELSSQPFKSGKYWQMLDYLDGNYLLRNSDPKPTREDYQNDLFDNLGFLDGDSAVLQKGWDLAINSALLCDFMPAKRKMGSIYLLEHVIWDKDSLFYPSVTTEFQKRVVNEAFWQSLFDYHQSGHNAILENILTNNYSDLNPALAEDNILRWSNFNKVNIMDAETNFRQLVSGTAGPENFNGLSPRAVENYGTFINKVYLNSDCDRIQLAPFVKSYIDAVNCTDYDGSEYFEEPEKKKLLRLDCVEESNLQKTI